MNIVKLLRLYGEGFIKALKTEVFHPPNCEYVDGTSGFTFKKAMEEMKNNYEAKYNIQRRVFVIAIYLVLSFFYDGIQLYKSKVSKFSPALLTIMNLPPHFRNRFGIGILIIDVVYINILLTSSTSLLFDIIYILINIRYVSFLDFDDKISFSS